MVEPLHLSGSGGGRGGRGGEKRSQAWGQRCVWLTERCCIACQFLPGAPRVSWPTRGSLPLSPYCFADWECFNLYSEFSSNDLKSVGNYTLGRLIGKGSFGKVYLATHKLTNGSKVSASLIGGCNMPILANHATQVVLKSANRTDSNLAREIHHHRQFVHPHIARLYEVIVTENLVWMVLEYCAGKAYNTAPEPVSALLFCFCASREAS